MDATLLIADPRWTWREWLKENLDGRDLVCLDVSDADHGPPGRVFLMREGKVRSWRFVGTVVAARNPVDVLAGGLRLAREASDDAVVLSFDVGDSPLLRQMALALAESVGAASVLIPSGSGLESEPWPVNPEWTELAEALPETVRIAQRRSRWLEVIEACDEHTLQLDEVGLYGVRLGSGERLTDPPFDKLGLHVEVCGPVLHVVSDEEPDETLVAEALNLSHASRLNLVSPNSYDGLVCSFVRGGGEDFGIGVVRSIDFEARRASFLSTAVAPAPVTAVRIGAVRIDETGKELGEARPWTV
ncbi:MAG: hypothetical protein IIC73_00290 [Armatimonadetes bacterium]|nr:hypothetical protein [Armatimonadota bacterium]